MLRRTVLLSVFITASLIFYISCNKSSDSGSGGGISSLFKAAFPEEAAVSSPTAQTTATTSSFGLQSEELRTLAEATDTADKKKAALTAILDGATSDACAININLYNSANANCYGPNLDYANHPDGSGGTQLPGGDLGLLDAAETSGEACAAAELNARMKGVASQVDAAFFAVASLMCTARNANLSLPANAGESLDVTPSLSGKVTINGQAATVTAATLARDTDSNGKPVYVSTIRATFGSKSAFIRLKHIPAGLQDESTFTGKVSISLSDTVRESGFDGNCSGSSGGQVDAASILYEKTLAGNLKYSLKSGNFCGSAADPFVSATNYSVNLPKTYAANNGGWGNNANILLADFVPSTGVGTYQYAWQAGRNDSHTRVLNVKISDATNAVAYFGFGPAASTTSPGPISTMICNWAGPGNNHSGQAKVQKQVMTRGATFFTATTSNITYDPVNACESSSGTFTYNKVGQSAVNASSTTSNLVNLTDWSSTITNVTAPTDVD